MILTKPTEAAAQELADRCHAWLIENDSASVKAGQTTAWAIPCESEDGTGWSVVVTERVMGALSDSELQAVTA